MVSDAGSFTARRRRLFSSLLVSISPSFLFSVEFLHGFLEILGLWVSFVVEGCARRFRCRIKAFWFLFIICNPVSPVMTMFGSDLVLMSYVYGIPRSTLRPDLKVQGLLFSSFCWRLTSLFAENIISELLWHDRDVSLTNSACFRSIYDDLCLWGSMIYLVVGSETSMSGTLFLLLELFHSLSPANMAFCEVPEICSFTPHKPFNANTPGMCSFTSRSTYSDVKRSSFGFVISLWLQHGNVEIGRLWRNYAFTLQSNLVKLPLLFARVVVKTYQTPLCWVQKTTLPHSSVKEIYWLLFAFSMRGTFCPDPTPVKFITALTDAIELILVRTKNLKCLSKSHAKVTICKLENLEVCLESSVISYASGDFKIIFNTLSSFSKLVFLSLYCFRCVIVVAMRLTHRVCPMLCSINVID